MSYTPPSSSVMQSTRVTCVSHRGHLCRGNCSRPIARTWCLSDRPGYLMAVSSSAWITYSSANRTVTAPERRPGPSEPSSASRMPGIDPEDLQRAHLAAFTSDPAHVIRRVQARLRLRGGACPDAVPLFSDNGAQGYIGCIRELVGQQGYAFDPNSGSSGSFSSAQGALKLL